MIETSTTTPLYNGIRRRYFGYGLAGMATIPGCRVITGWLHLEGPAALGVTVLAGLAVIWVGSLGLRRVISAPEQILSQLTTLARNRNVDKKSLVPIPEAWPAAAGWNQLLEHIQSGRLSPEMETRLSEALSGGGLGDMSLVLNSLTDGIAVTRPDGLITSSNRSFCALMNIDEDSADAADASAIFDLLAQQVQGGEPPAELQQGQMIRQRFELKRTLRDSDGVLRISCTPIENSRGDTASYVWTVRDITQLKLAESMRTEFVTTATHELRTPLANIRAYAETLQATDDISLDEQKEFVNVINSESVRLSRFVDELLNLSQMDAGSITIRRHETQFDRLLQESIENARPQIVKKDQTLETRIPAKLPAMNVDKDKIAACLVNLLGNASKYTPEGGVIRLIVDESATELSVRIEDNGFGIEASEIPQLFGRFFRSNDPRVRAESGSGIGLSYAHEVARLHGGDLTVESELDKGSEFTLKLPLTTS